MRAASLGDRFTEVELLLLLLVSGFAPLESEAELIETDVRLVGYHSHMPPLNTHRIEPTRYQPENEKKTKNERFFFGAEVQIATR